MINKEREYNTTNPCKIILGNMDSVDGFLEFITSKTPLPMGMGLPLEIWDEQEDLCGW